MKPICSTPIFQSKFKISVVGCGNVGATTAYALLLDGLASELVLFDKDKGKAEGIDLDFEHSLPFLTQTKVTATDDYKTMADSRLVIITSGARQEEGETRLQLVDKNRAIFKELIPQITAVAPDCIILVVTNPVDILTYEAARLSGFPRNRVFGTGTFLDTARLRFYISERLCLDPHSIDAFVLGEHGDSSFAVWSSAHVAGKSLFDFEGFTQKDAQDCFEKTKNAAYRIIHGLGYTCYSIATVIREITRHILHNSRAVVPLSTVLQGEYGLTNVALSVPCVIDSSGVSEIVTIPLNAEEKQNLEHSASVLKKLT